MIQPRGNPSSPIWVVVEEPYAQDSEKGYVYSCPYGYVFNKCWDDAGISESPYIIAVDNDFTVLTQGLDKHKPVLICAIGEIVASKFCPETSIKDSKGGSLYETSLEKYSGSLLNSRLLSYPHYIIPLLPPDRVVANWAYRFIYIGIDLGHVAEEFTFYRNHKQLNPLPTRKITIRPSYEELMDNLYAFQRTKYLSTDIETIRPVKNSPHYGHPGYPYTISLAPSSKESIAFSFWDYKEEQNAKIWRQLSYLFSSVPQIGQNYFTFDTHFLEAMGFTICLDKCEDTMLRHQLLWPELPHKLQFLTKQYTRQPYYKDEGRGWSPRRKDQLFHYNALDTLVTYEVFERQEEEFNDRPYLR